MAHVRQQIRDRIADILSDVTHPPANLAANFVNENYSTESQWTSGQAFTVFRGNVYKMRRYALDDAKLPAIAVYTVDESSNLITIGSRTLRRVVNVGIEIVAKGASTTIADTVDDYVTVVEEAIANDFTINGLAKSCILTSSTIDVNVEGEKAVGTARLVFAVEYITAINDVETAR